MVELPADLAAEVDALVSEGRFATREAAVAELVRLGLATLRRRPRAPGEPPMPPGVPPPPGYHEPPADDRPIDVKPWDTKWVE